MPAVVESPVDATSNSYPNVGSPGTISLFQVNPADSKPATAASTSSTPAYVRFLSTLHSAWKDVPHLSVSYRDLSVVFPGGGAKSQPADKRSQHVPNLYSTIRSWAVEPARAVASKLGIMPAMPPLYAVEKAHGIIQPGSMTLVLAPPGHGKSSLLKALSGRLPASSIRGELLYNGRTPAELKASGVQLTRMAAYVGQVDLHFPTLTVRETLEFASQSSVASPQLLGNEEIIQLEKQRANMLIDMLGLTECADTIVGNEMLRGVSGGQKKRVTLGEMIVSNARLLCLDEVSTGLDAAVTTSIFTHLRQMCQVSGSSVVTALLQPTPETYAQFDQVILLHDGRVLYHGPRSEIKRWLWNVCGIDVPVDVDEASFLVEFLVDPKLAYESATVIAQTASFMDTTRAAREADIVAAVALAEAEGSPDEVVQLSSDAKNSNVLAPHHAAASSVHYAPPVAIRAPAPSNPNSHPELYQSYATFATESEGTRAPQGESYPNGSKHVTFHVESDSDSGSKESSECGEDMRMIVTPPAQTTEGTAAGSSMPRLPSSTALASSSEVDSIPIPTKMLAKQRVLRAEAQHSTVGAKPAKDMNEILTRYEASKYYQDLHSKIAESSFPADPLNPSLWTEYTRANFSRPYPHSYFHHVRLCFARQWKLFIRNLAVMIPRLFKSISIGLCYGLLFYNLGFGDFTTKLAVCMYGAVYACMTNLSELPIASEARNIINKQLHAGFYPASPYTFAVNAMHIPLTVVESFGYSALIYWLAGMDGDVSRYFFYVFVCFVCSNAMAAFYRCVSYITPNPDVAKQLDLPFVVLFIILNGYIIVYNKIPVWLRYSVFWATPLQWATKSLTLNEYSSKKYDGPSVSDPTLRMGDSYLQIFDFPTDVAWKWWGVLYLACWYLTWMALCVLALNKIALVSPMGSERERYYHVEDADKKKKQRASVEMASIDAPAADDCAIDIETRPQKKNPAFQLSALPFTPQCLAWSHVNYSVTLPNGTVRTLLKDVSGFARPGEMTALMGASGAGKTTLMDCIAGRKTTGHLDCDVRMNGVSVDIHSSTFQQSTGYCEQNDLHIGTATVEESFRFSARLRLPTSVPIEVQHNFVKEVMELLDLTPFAHCLVGDAAISGLSPAQLKLVTIGVELVANPSILFLDEPTSGLDATAAWKVMTAIKRISLSGRTVLCTIHQPSARLFYLFDNLLLLQPGGKTIYSHSIGHRGETLVSYFEAASEFRNTLPKGVNPANWMLEITAPQHDHEGEKGSQKQEEKPVAVDWPAVWLSSSIYRHFTQPALALALEPPAKSSASSAPTTTSEYASWLLRYELVQKRLFLSYWRNGPMNLTRAAISFIISLLLGLIYFRIRPTDYAGVNSFLAGIFMSLGFGPSLACTSALPTFYRQRAVFYREQTVRMYGNDIYALSLTVSEFLTQLVLQMIYIIPLYFLMDLSHNPHQFWRFYFILFLLSQVFAFISQFYLAYLPSQVSSSVVHSIVFSFLFVFGGLLVKAKSYPVGWKWLYAMISTPKAFIAVALGQLSCSDEKEFVGGFGCGYILPPESTTPVQVYEFVSDQLQNSYESYGNQVGWLILILVVIKIFTLIGFRYISHLKR